MSLVSVWDGTSRTRLDPNVIRAPDGDDWARIVRELQESQQAILTEASFFGGEAANVIKPGNVVQVRTTDSKITLASTLPAGVALNNVAPTELVVFVQVGNLELPDWTQAVGTTQLSPGQRYYLGPSGSLTLTPPTTGYLVRVGLSINSTTMAIKIHDPIRL